MPPSRDDATSSEMRHDWLTDRWVIMAPQRSSRPIDFVRQPIQVNPNANCPFCAGHETQTPNAIACYIAHNKNDGIQNRHDAAQNRCNSLPKWHVRVVPNKFPAVTQATSNLVTVESLTSVSLGQSTSGQSIGNNDSIGWLVADSLGGSDTTNNSQKLFQRRDLSGGHEVIIEGSGHVQSLSQLDRETLKLVFQAYRDRLQYWLIEQAIAYAVIFKNVGQEAGASLVHSHSQLIATDIVPTDVTRAARRMELFYEQEAECLFCRTVQDELVQQVRLVEQSANYIAYCPFASRLPSLVTITSKHHLGQFELLTNEQLEELSWLVYRIVSKMELCFPEAAYNYVIHTAPFEQQGSPSFHWRLDLFPRISTKAGFEWGSECFINPLPPEESARQLRLARV